MDQDPVLLEKLLKEDEHFRKTFDAHKSYDRKVDELEKRQHLTDEETFEKKRLKKLKLALRDEMERIIVRHRSGTH